MDCNYCSGPQTELNLWARDESVFDTNESGGEVKRKLGIVGKGLTFDSGGYNLKGAGWDRMGVLQVGGRSWRYW